MRCWNKKNRQSFPSCITIGARVSPLSLRQVEEVKAELRRFVPAIEFEVITLETMGDRDKKTSLRTLEKTDFFTRELDELLLANGCQAVIHSAKDLPNPLREGLCVAALTKGVDPADVVVLPRGLSLETLPAGACIATSSERREAAVRAVRPDLSFCDLRGTIDERLAKLDREEVAGVVVAEAALIRLGYTHRHRQRLPGSTVPLQGRLAIVVREHDEAMGALFACLHDSEADKDGCR